MNNITNVEFATKSVRPRTAGAPSCLVGMIFCLLTTSSWAFGQIVVKNETDDVIRVGIIAAYNDQVTMNGWYELRPGEESKIDGNFFKGGRVWHLAVNDLSKNQSLFKKDLSGASASLSMRTTDCWISNDKVNWKSGTNAFLAKKVASGDWEALKNTVGGLQKHRALRIHSTKDHKQCTVHIQSDGNVKCHPSD